MIPQWFWRMVWNQRALFSWDCKHSHDLLISCACVDWRWDRSNSHACATIHVECLSMFIYIWFTHSATSDSPCLYPNPWRLLPRVRCKARRKLSARSSRLGSTTWTICELLVVGMKRIIPMWVRLVIHIEISPPSICLRGFLRPHMSLLTVGGSSHVGPGAYISGPVCSFLVFKHCMITTRGNYI